MNTFKIRNKIMMLGIFLAFLSTTILSSCVTTVDEQIDELESYLGSFNGQKARDVVNEFGYPTKYINRPESKDYVNGTMMMYDYPEDGCTVYFTFKEKTQEIVDWDYEGNCMDVDFD